MKLRAIKLTASLLATLLVAALLFPGCALLGGGGAQRKPSPSDEDIKKMIREELKSPDMKAEIEDIVGETAMIVRAEEMIKAPETQKVMQEQLAKLLATPDTQKVLQEQMKKAMEGQEIQKTLENMVRSALMSILTGQGGQGGSQKGSGQSGGGQGGSDQSSGGSGQS